MTKYLNAVRLCKNMPSNRLCFLSTNSLVNTSSTKKRNALMERWPFNDVVTNFIRNIERDFEWTRHKMERTLGDLAKFDLLPPTSTIDNDFIETDENGNRKFRLVFDLRDYEPENIKIKTKDLNFPSMTNKEQYLILSAKKESKVYFIYFNCLKYLQNYLSYF